MRWLLPIIIVSFCACQPLPSPQELADLKTAYYRDLMIPEGVVVGDYLEKREFHGGLMFECREPSAEPYREMVSLMDTLEAYQIEMITIRGRFYAKAEEIEKQALGKGARKATKTMKLAHGKSREQQDAHAKRYFVFSSRYDALVTQNDIRCFSHIQYAELLEKRLVMWQDSLMLQGQYIGGHRQQFKTSGMEKTDEDYQKRYTPLSEMEALHKRFQNVLVQVENQQGRYAAARPDEVFYLGPLLVERSDYEASEGQFVKLIAMMAEFRAYHNTFVAFPW
jgi:hypothetical protein